MVISFMSYIPTTIKSIETQTIWIHFVWVSLLVCAINFFFNKKILFSSRSKSQFITDSWGFYQFLNTKMYSSSTNNNIPLLCLSSLKHQTKYQGTCHHDTSVCGHGWLEYLVMSLFRCGFPALSTKIFRLSLSYPPLVGYERYNKKRLMMFWHD